MKFDHHRHVAKMKLFLFIGKITVVMCGIEAFVTYEMWLHCLKIAHGFLSYLVLGFLNTYEILEYLYG